jgi:hypothetical protein
MYYAINIGKPGWYENCHLILLYSESTVKSVEGALIEYRR